MSPETEQKVIETLGRLDERTALLLRIVAGDGQPGLVQKVEDLEASRRGAKYVGSVVVFLSGVAEWFFHRGGHH